MFVISIYHLISCDVVWTGLRNCQTPGSTSAKSHQLPTPLIQYSSLLEVCMNSWTFCSILLVLSHNPHHCEGYELLDFFSILPSPLAQYSSLWRVWTPGLSVLYSPVLSHNTPHCTPGFCVLYSPQFSKIGRFFRENGKMQFRGHPTQCFLMGKPILQISPTCRLRAQYLSLPSV